VLCAVLVSGAFACMYGGWAFPHTRYVCVLSMWVWVWVWVWVRVCLYLCWMWTQVLFFGTALATPDPRCSLGLCSASARLVE